MKSAAKEAVIWGLSIAPDKSVSRTPFSDVPRGCIDVYRAKNLSIVEFVNMDIVGCCNKIKIGMLFKSRQRLFFKREYKLIKLSIM
jgi:hypothetical protein